MEKRILIEDEHLLGVRKQAGELVVADRWGREPNVLLHLVGEYLRARGHRPDETGRDLYPVHRLDRDTSGVVLFAKHQEAHRLLSRMFEEREMRKVYWALTAGLPEWDHCRCEIPLSRAEGKKGRGRALIDLNRGKDAVTEFRLRERLGDIAWMEAMPLTGRLHQIRVHLRALGHPILWDEAYWDPNWQSQVFPDLSPQRLPLHARSIEFRHPLSQQDMKIECPMDEDMRSLINRLKGELDGRPASESLQ
jgi:23S rRNA pseudouridine955/2504/2580 synthase/23S rRNA pseudouridine1911/1915/1917 synthase